MLILAPPVDKRYITLTASSDKDDDLSRIIFSEAFTQSHSVSTPRAPTHPLTFITDINAQCLITFTYHHALSLSIWTLHAGHTVYKRVYSIMYIPHPACLSSIHSFFLFATNTTGDRLLSGHWRRTPEISSLFLYTYLASRFNLLSLYNL